MDFKEEFNNFLKASEKKTLFPILIWTSLIVWLIFLIASSLLGGLKFGWRGIGTYLVIFFLFWILSFYFFRKGIHLELVKYIDSLFFIFLFTYLIFSYQDIWPVFFLGYTLLVSLMGLSYEPKSVLFLGFFSLFSFGVLLFFLENTIFNELENLIPIGISVAILSVGTLLGSYGSGRLRNSMLEIFRRNKRMEEMNAVLEIRIRARTRELQEQADALRKEAREKTKALEVKKKELQERVEELEKFQKLTVGRELKMIELKEELQRLRKELEKFKRKK